MRRVVQIAATMAAITDGNVSGIERRVYALRDDGVIFENDPDGTGDYWNPLPPVPGVDSMKLRQLSDEGDEPDDEALPIEPGKRDPVPPGVAITSAREVVDKLFRIPADERFRLFDRLCLLPSREVIAELNKGEGFDTALASLVVAEVIGRDEITGFAAAIDECLAQVGR